MGSGTPKVGKGRRRRSYDVISWVCACVCVCIKAGIALLLLLLLLPPPLPLSPPPPPPPPPLPQCSRWCRALVARPQTHSRHPPAAARPLFPHRPAWLAMRSAAVLALLLCAGQGERLPARQHDPLPLLPQVHCGDRGFSTSDSSRSPAWPMVSHHTWKNSRAHPHPLLHITHWCPGSTPTKVTGGR